MPSPTTHAFAERHQTLRAALLQRRHPQERLAWVVDQARARPPFPAPLRTADRLVPGCAARLWLVAEREGNRCHYSCDSDSAILKAAAGLLCDLYTGLTIAEIVHEEPAFLHETGLMHQFTENRQRTIGRVREAIRDFARSDRKASP